MGQQVVTYIGVLFAGYLVIDVLSRRFSLSVANRLDLLRKNPLSDVDNVVRLSFWVIGMACLYPVALATLRVDRDLVLINDINLMVLAYGVLLGLGEAHLGQFLCYVAMRATLAQSDREYRRQAQTEPPLRVRPNSSWIGSGVIPIPCMLALLLLYAALEELMLRGMLIAGTLQISHAMAIGLSVGLSLAVQMFPWTPGRRRLFSFIGTSVTAPVHAVLFLAVPDVRPLVIARFVSLYVTGP